MDTNNQTVDSAELPLEAGANEAEPLYALTIRQPWAWLIVRPDVRGEERRAKLAKAQLIKDVENRVWSTNRRGRIYIHAGQQWDCDGDESYARRLIMHEYALELPLDLPLGMLVGFADIVDCVEKHPSRWFTGPYGFVLANITPLEKPIKCRGKQGFFKIDPVLAAKLRG